MLTSDSSSVGSETIKMEYAGDSVKMEAEDTFIIEYAEETTPQRQQNLDLKTRIKSRLINVLHSSSFCGLCLETDGLIPLEKEKCSIHSRNKESLEGIILKVFGNEIMDRMPSKQICGSCKDNVEHAYQFISQVTGTAKILRNYLEQIENNVEEFNAMVTPDCNIGNIIIVLQDYDDTEITDKSVKNVKRKGLIEDSDEENLCLLSCIKMKNIFQCYLCDKIFSSRQYLKVHIKTHNLQNQSKVSKTKEPCLECKGSCVHEKYLNAIKKQKERQTRHPYVLSCVDCNYKCTNKSSYLGHVNKHHLKMYPYLCDNCGQKFHSRMALCIHAKVYHPTCTDCYYCDLHFNRGDELFTHTQYCMKKQRAHKCKMCPASFDQEERLLKHITNHESENTCQICLKTFHNVSTYRRHIASAHREDRATINRVQNKIVPRNILRTCSICNAVTFSSLKEWKAHMGTHDPEDTHKCLTCNKEYTDYKVYQKHLKSYTHLLKVDPNTKFAFACNFCGFTAQTNRDLESHKNIKHLKQKPHQCQLCEKSFATRDNLKGHQVRHTGVKNFKCDECNAVFSSTTGLKKHCFRNHSIGDHYICNVCGKTFLYISLYELHVKRKHSEPTELCPLCKGAYHTNVNLRGHLLKVHAKGRDIKQFIMEENLEEVFRDRRLQHVE